MLYLYRYYHHATDLGTSRVVCLLLFVFQDVTDNLAASLKFSLSGVLMARFRAYASDSSDDGSASEPEKRPQHASEEDGSESGSDQETSSSSSSEMHEDELVSSRIRHRQKPKRNALVEDEDGEIQYADEMNNDRRPAVRVSSASSSSSSSTPPPPRAAHRDPTVIPWAQHIGVDPQKMHVMQTSLFRMPEEAAALKTMNQPTRSNLRIPLQPLNRKHSRDSDGDGLRVDSREVCVFVRAFSSENASPQFDISDDMLYVCSAPHSHTISTLRPIVLRGSMHVSKAQPLL